MSLDYAVFTEFSPQTKVLKPRWNPRVFTDIEAQKGSSIRCDLATGIVTLAPGTYRLTGFSMVAYDAVPPGATSIHAPASAGYCRLRLFDPAEPEESADVRAVPNGDRRVIGVGSPSTPHLSPSLVDVFHETAVTAQIVLEHQSGPSSAPIHLRVYAEESRWHAFARLAVHKL